MVEVAPPNKPEVDCCGCDVVTDDDPNRPADCCGWEAAAVDEVDGAFPNKPEGLGVVDAVPKRLEPVVGWELDAEPNKPPGAGG